MEWIYLLAVALVVVILLAIPFFLRVVVPTNEVHIVQSSGKRISYGKMPENGEGSIAAGNTYYRIPSWIPKWGVVTSTLPLNVFPVELADYAAYDSGRVPFKVDIMAFFRVTDPGVAAERISSFEELHSQLMGILQSSVRAILASHDIEEIMQGRSSFGEAFTKEVDSQLLAWGVQSVKNIEFMDIRDADSSQVIQNIMAKKMSLIEKESRTTVAENQKLAEVAEIEAQREVDVQQQAALQQVGLRTAEKDQTVGIANEKARQAIQEEAKTTAEKAMAVKRVEEVRKAEIAQQVAIVNAEAEKQATVTTAQGDLQQTQLRAEGIKAEGSAKAEAEKALLTAQADGEKAMQLASVTAQTTLAEKIGQNEGYQTYLVRIEQVKATKDVGIAQAEALKGAEIKVVVGAGDASSGLNRITDMLSPKGGIALAGAIEALAQTETGKELVNRITGAKSEE